nr:hypothetical protein 7 [bacterium]
MSPTKQARAANKHKIIISLFDYSGAWSQPYVDAGYTIIQWDIKHGCDALEWFPNQVIDKVIEHHNGRVVGILAAPPCTDFSASGAQFWPRKDAPGSAVCECCDTVTEHAVALVLTVLVLVEIYEPDFWVVENPAGRLPKLVPELGRGWFFQPWWFGDAYTKLTGLWGNFNRNLKRDEVEPVRACKAGSWLMKLGGNRERTKELRSMTPPGFARAFFEANH